MLNQPKILVVGSLMMDLIASTPVAPKAGETVIGSAFHTVCGGKGANQAVQCARLGAAVTMVGQVGGDAFGQQMLSNAAAAGVDVRHVLTDSQCASGVAHILLEVAPQGTQNRITVIPGANYTTTPEQIAWLEDEIGAYDMVLLQLEIPMAVNLAVARYAKAAGVPVMLNPAPAAALPPELLRCVAYLSPNEHEAAALTGLPLQAGPGGVDQAGLQAVASALRGQGVETVLITLGGNGSALAASGGLSLCPCVSMPEVQDPTAAGDSFVATFCTGITAGLAPADALTFASHAAAITVSRMGAMPSLPTLAEVQALLRQRAAPLDLSALEGLRHT